MLPKQEKCKMINNLVKISLILFCCSVSNTFSRSEPFILGADISWIPQREAGGVRYADNGTVKDIFEILGDYRFNYIRLRLFVDPTATVPGESESPYSRQGYCGLESTLQMAKRVKDAGMKFLLDFHYSDTWADPGKQHKPMSWRELNFNQLTEKVRSYTRETLERFEQEGVLPDMVQVGNEVVGGMIWPDGRNSNMSNFATLVNAGIDGVKDVDENILIMIHTIAERNPNNWLTSLKNAGVNRIDVFGLSYYEEWHGTVSDLRSMVNAIAANHNEKIVVVEYSEQHRSVNDVIFDLPNNQGMGTFVWEPCDWRDVLLTWRNNRRETNEKIHLYPVMSQEYGNDDFEDKVSTGDNDYPFTLYQGITSQSDKFLFSSDNGVLRYFSDDPATVSMFTFKGRLVGQCQIKSPGIYHPAFDISGTSTVQSGRYVLIIDSRGQQRKVFTTQFFR